MFNVRTFGATGDGVTLDTNAINAAIRAAHEAGGGTVLFPPGAYLSFSLRLFSNITLHLDAGATLLAAGDPPPSHEDILAMLTPDGILPGGGAGDSGSFYAGDTFGQENPAAPAPMDAPQKPALSFAQAFENRKSKIENQYDPPEPNEHNKYQDHGHSHWHNSLIHGENLSNIAITGAGTIDGRGLTWNADPANPTGNKAIALKRCTNVTLRDFTLFRAGHFAIIATGCNLLTIDNLKIDTNRDGLDIDSCQHVSISNCFVNTPNDDAIVLKSSFALGEPRPTAHVTITNCHLSGYDMGSLLDGSKRTTQKIAPDKGGVTGRIKFGTESNGGFQNIAISNCSFSHCRGIALETVDGGPLEDIAISNITMRDVTSAPLFVRLGNRARGPAHLPVSTARRISFTNIIAHNAEPRFASLFSGIPGHRIEDLRLSNITLRYKGGGAKRDAQRTPPENENGYPDPVMFGVIPSYGLYFRHIKNLHLSNISLAFQNPDHRPPIHLEDVHTATLDNITAERLPAIPFLICNAVTALTLRHCATLPDTHHPNLPNAAL
ncbi:MAG TPA: glycosyl hydrolase family 28 protein [Phycisphaerae bacterium]|nr:glycosyl hydrolase family 28 protein [Phycisphaerae bacterium]